MNILYVSCLCSDHKMHELFDTAKEKPHPAPQKYHSLMVKGLVANKQNVTCLVSLPVTKRSHPKHKWWRWKDEMEGNVHYVYMPFYNHPVPKLLGFKIFAFFYTLIWSLRTSGKKVMICDVLNPHAFASMRACKLTGVKSVGIVTDIPGYMNFDKKKVSLIEKLEQQHAIRNLRRMSALIPLTDAMCDIINPQRKKTYTVIEGMVDSRMKNFEPIPFGDNKRHITYTGSLNEAFGIRMLIEGFMLLKQKDIVLDIYGAGQVEKDMNNYMKRDERIRFHGMVSVEEAVKAQLSSYLLVNPRPTTEDFTKYSFPSKNMEYMVTGVPLLTAVLPGMPVEYHPNVFLFEDETVTGLSHKLNEILNMPEEIVKARGRQGKMFVMENKNNIRQAERVVKMLEQ